MFLGWPAGAMSASRIRRNLKLEFADDLSSPAWTGHPRTSRRWSNRLTKRTRNGTGDGPWRAIQRANHQIGRAATAYAVFKQQGRFALSTRRIHEDVYGRRPGFIPSARKNIRLVVRTNDCAKRNGVVARLNPGSAMFLRPRLQEIMGAASRPARPCCFFIVDFDVICVSSTAIASRLLSRWLGSPASSSGLLQPACAL